MIDLKHEIKRELGLISPPDLWERIQADAETDDLLVSAHAIDARHRRRRSGWLAVAAVAVLLALVALKALPGADPTVDTGPATEGPAVSGPPTTLSLADLANARQFRAGNVVVTIQCTATKSSPDSDVRDLVLGGVVTDNPDNRASVDGVGVAVGDLLALIIRDNPGLPRRVTLYEPSTWHGPQATAGSCNELVESVPVFLDGGFFAVDTPGVFEILPGG